MQLLRSTPPTPRNQIRILTKDLRKKQTPISFLSHSNFERSDRLHGKKPLRDSGRTLSELHRLITADKSVLTAPIVENVPMFLFCQLSMKDSSGNSHGRK
jgi:hypothetical protein